MSRPPRGTDDPLEVLRLLGRMVTDINDTESRLSRERATGQRPGPGHCNVHPTEDHCRGGAVLDELQRMGLDVLPRWASDQAAALVGAHPRKPHITMYDVESSPN